MGGWKQSDVVIIFIARGKRGNWVRLPTPCLDIERVSSLRVIGVIVNDQLTATDHVFNILASYIQYIQSAVYTLYESCAVMAPQTLRIATWCISCDHHREGDLLRTIVLRCVLCRRPSQAIESFVRRCKRLEYCSSEIPTYSDLTDQADDTLFSRIMTNQGHVLQPLLPDRHPIWDKEHNKTQLNISITMTF